MRPIRFDIKPQHIKTLKDTKSGAPEQDAVIKAISEGLQESKDESYHKIQIEFLIRELTGSAVLDKTYVSRLLIVAKIYCQVKPQSPVEPLSPLNIVILNAVKTLLTRETLQNRLATLIKFLEERPFFLLMTDTFENYRNEPFCLMDELTSVAHDRWSAPHRENLWTQSWRAFDDLFQQQMRYSVAFARCIFRQLYNLLEPSRLYADNSDQYYNHRKFLSQFGIKENLLHAMHDTQDQKDHQPASAGKHQLIETTLTCMGELPYLRQSVFVITIDDILTHTSFSITTQALNVLTTQGVSLWLDAQQYEKYLKQAQDEKYEGVSDQMMMHLACKHVSVLGALLTLSARSAAIESSYFSEGVVMYYFVRPSYGYSGEPHVKKLEPLTPDQKIRLLNFMFSDYFFDKFKINFLDFASFVGEVISHPDLSQLSNVALKRLWQKRSEIPAVNQKFTDDASFEARALAAIGVVVSDQLVSQCAAAREKCLQAQENSLMAQEELVKMRADMAALKAENVVLKELPLRTNSPYAFFSSATHVTPRQARVDDSADTSPRAVWDEKSDSDDEKGRELQLRASRPTNHAGDAACAIALPALSDDEADAATAVAAQPSVS